jgi:DNA-binding transcriptional MerR regulator
MTTAPVALSLTELAERVGLTPRGVRAWVAAGVLPRPALHGSATTYGPEHLVRARAAIALRKKGARLGEIARWLAKASPEELATLAPPPARVVDAPPPPPPAPTFVADRWDRVQLLPGLELAVRADAPEVVRRIAADIVAHYGGLTAR